jgi:hypothetical protein
MYHLVKRKFGLGKKSLVQLIFFYLLFLSSWVFSALTLTITTSGGQTGTSGTYWTATGSNPVQILATGNASINPSVIQAYLNNGQNVVVESPSFIAVNSNVPKGADSAPIDNT